MNNVINIIDGSQFRYNNTDYIIGLGDNNKIYIFFYIDKKLVPIRLNDYSVESKKYFINALLCEIVRTSTITDINILRDYIVEFITKPRVIMVLTKTTSRKEQINNLVKIFNERYTDNYGDFVSDPSQTRKK